MSIQGSFTGPISEYSAIGYLDVSSELMAASPHCDPFIIET